MKMFYGQSKSGDLREAVSGLGNPKLIILMSNQKQFETHVEQLEQMYPGVPSIGCIAMSYGIRTVEEGVGITAFSDGVEALANVMEQVSVMPVKYIGRLEEDLRKIHADKNSTVCIDLCSGNDACVLTTMGTVMDKSGIQIMGGTGDQGKVSCNGKIYADAVAYTLIKNNGGKVKTYKENIYRPMEGCRFIASKTDRSKYYIGELNGKPAKSVYSEIFNIHDGDITNQTFKNPLGKLNGQDLCIISVKEPSGTGLSCYRQINDSDVLTLLEAKNYREIVDETIGRIHSDFHRISGVFSVNCIFRYLLFCQTNELDAYLKQMGQLGNHCGLFGFGEHYNGQFVNQSMTCAVFE